MTANISFDIARAPRVRRSSPTLDFKGMFRRSDKAYSSDCARRKPHSKAVKWNSPFHGIEEAQMAAWVKQAAALPGWGG